MYVFHRVGFNWPFTPPPPQHIPATMVTCTLWSRISQFACSHQIAWQHITRVVKVFSHNYPPPPTPFTPPCPRLPPPQSNYPQVMNVKVWPGGLLMEGSCVPPPIDHPINPCIIQQPTGTSVWATATEPLEILRYHLKFKSMYLKLFYIHRWLFCLLFPRDNITRSSSQK